MNNPFPASQSCPCRSDSSPQGSYSSGTLLFLTFTAYRNGEHALAKPYTQPSSSALPAHIAVIMDGNGRWASKRGLPRTRGHLEGMEAVRTLVSECRSLGIPYVTLYAFSKENWRRPVTEVHFLFQLFQDFLRKELPYLMEQDIRLAFIGEKGDLPFAARQALSYALEKTSGNSSMRLTLAISYSGREEILNAVRRLLAEGVRPDELDGESFRQRLYSPDLPDPDLIIRTSGEKRISNFLLYQSAYAEFYFSSLLWPDFDAAELHRALEDYAGRERRFGSAHADGNTKART